MPIKTFRAKLADEGQDTIRLSTTDGLTGYRIVKFETMVANPGVTSQQSVVKVFTVDPNATPTSTIDFDDSTLLAASMLQETATTDRFDSQNIIFDGMVFNQDIFITHKDYNTGEEINYHLELEQIKLDHDEAAVATLKDMRGRE